MDIIEESQITTLDFTYNANGLLIGLHAEGKEYFYIRNLIGEIIKIIDEEGNDVVKYEYTAFGKPTKTIVENCVASIHNPFMYKGYYYDEETQLFYCNSRYYSPELCRWISPDSIEYLDSQSINGLNLYAYCGNDPVMCR